MTLVSGDDEARARYAVAWTPPTGVGTLNDLLASARPSTDAEALIRAADQIDPSFITEIGRQFDQSLNALMASGSLLIRRAPPQPRAERVAACTPPQKRGRGRTRGKRTRTREQVYVALNAYLDKYGVIPALETLAHKLGLKRPTMYLYIDDPAYFGSRPEFKRYCEDYLRRHPR